MKHIKKIILVSIICVFMFINTAYAQSAKVGDVLITCNEDGTQIGKGEVFTKVGISISGIDKSGYYLYYGVDIGAFKKSQHEGKWEAVFIERVPTNSLEIEIEDLMDISKYEYNTVYMIGYRVLYRPNGVENNPIIETEWIEAEDSCFMIKDISISTDVENYKDIVFSDLDNSHWAYASVMKMVGLGILEGYGDGTFRPDEPITREQFAKILVLSLNMPLKEPKEPTFADVSKDSWAYKYIETAKNYLTGYKVDGKLYFRGQNVAVREDMAVSIVKAKGLNNRLPNLSVLDSYLDKNDISFNLRNHMAIAVENKIMEGYSNMYLGPQKTLTRAEACELVYKSNILSKQDGEKVTIDD